MTQVPLVTGLDPPTKMVASPFGASQFYVAGKNGQASLVDTAAGAATTLCIESVAHDDDAVAAITVAGSARTPWDSGAATIAFA